ncbi:MAG: S8 family peptidase [Saprospiraceae bacterium]
MKCRFLLVIALVGSVLFNVYAQEGPPKNWFNLDMTQDSVPGISTERTYQNLLKGKKGRTVIVAVIDSGVDYEHEDLKEVMWVNADEIPNNGVDDDKNGYVDDIHGWNFLGGKNGENVHHDTYEVTRLYKALKAKYEGKNPSSLSGDEKKEYDKYLEYKKVIEEKIADAKPKAENFGATLEAINALEKAINKDTITLADLKKFKSKDRLLTAVTEYMRGFLEEGASFSEIKDQIEELYHYYNDQIAYSYNLDYNPRNIVGDNYADVNERYYGNNDVRGPDSEHGTHVAGIIAAKRGNGIGMDGVADNVRIMSIRTVPDGDERDKDVANAIYYAVDNGASVINMSFGKGASPEKEAVDKAIKYALKNDVLIVHAAGNDGKENDFTNNFPNDKFSKKGLFGPKYAENWLEVGASNWEGGESATASFSNYSKDLVDVFAPGTEIYSTVPGSKYKNLQGTSMASPVVAGVAAVLRSYNPKLTARQVKDIIMQSVTPVKEKVYKPGTDELVPFSQLAVTGGYINMYKAVEIATRTKGKRVYEWGGKNKKNSKEPVAIP